MKNTNQIKIGALALLVCATPQIANAQISTTPSSLSNFTTTVGNASTVQALTVNTTGPLDAFVALAPLRYEISSNSSAGFGRGIITIEAPLETI